MQEKDSESPPALLGFLVTAGLFLGGVPLGQAATHHLIPEAPGLLTFFMLPCAFIAAMTAWQFTALLRLIFKSVRERRIAEDARPSTGAWVMIPVSVVVCGIQGAILAIWAPVWWSAALAIAGLGAVYGTLLYLAARFELLAHFD